LERGGVRVEEEGDDVSVMRMEGVEEGGEGEGEYRSEGEEKKEGEEEKEQVADSGGTAVKKGWRDRLRVPSFVTDKPVKSMRRFSVTGLRRWSVSDQADHTIEPYMPAIKFRERMDRRYEKFGRRKEEIRLELEGAEHNRVTLEVKKK
jgi:hypothetical protein